MMPDCFTPSMKREKAAGRYNVQEFYEKDKKKSIGQAASPGLELNLNPCEV
jgi:hypothetical protein